jgi:hypothetical protein
LQAKSKSLEKVPVPEVEEVKEIDLEKEVEVFFSGVGSQGSVDTAINVKSVTISSMNPAFQKKILSKKYGITRYCCPKCLDEYLK